jgi:hypothetical protein
VGSLLSHPADWLRFTAASLRRSTLLLSGILSQVELLTFILFWTLANNIVYMF